MNNVCLPVVSHQGESSMPALGHWKCMEKDLYWQPSGLEEGSGKKEKVFWAFESKKKEREINSISAGTIEIAEEGFGPRLWLLVSPVSSSGPQQTAEREEDGEETYEAVAGWPAVRHLPLTHQPPASSPPLSTRGE